jgi:large subunit ribosomal protein L6
MSRIGKKPVAIPSGVKVDIKGTTIVIEGPKGKVQKTFPDRIKMAVKDNTIVVDRVSNIATDKALHGLFRAIVANMVVGVTAGYTKEMEVNGVGFKAVAQGSKLTMTLGFSHPVIIEMPEGIKVETPKPTSIVLKGLDKEIIGEIAARIRSVYPPEPYKGKGIRYVGEFVRKKVGKAQATGK